MTTKILTALTAFAALTAFTSTSAHTLEHYLDTGSGEGGSGGMTAKSSTFQVTFTAALTRRFQVNATRSDVVFQAKAPVELSASSTNVHVTANSLTMQFEASTVLWLQARGPMRLSRKSA